MKLVVVSSPKDQPNETVEIIRMFETGLEYFHVRKPRMGRKELIDYIKLFPEKYRKRLIIHSYHGLASNLNLGGIHLSRKHRKRGKFYRAKLYLKRKFNKNLIVTRTFHKLTDITNEKRKYSYTFLSPVFDSITHSTLSGGFSKRALLIMIPQARQPVYALGGVTEERFPEISDLGFEGAVLLGSIWNSEEAPHIVFKKALAAANNL